MPIRDLQEAIDLIEAGQAAEAFPLLTTWAQQMPTYAAVHAVLARAYEAVGQWEEAREAWERTRFLMPNSPAVREGEARVRAAMRQAVPAGEDRLIMDLDLETELEATLEALFNPFTLPQSSSEIVFEGELMVEEDTALAQAEAALAAEADTDTEEAADEQEETLVDEEEIIEDDGIADEAEEVLEDDDVVDDAWAEESATEEREAVEDEAVAAAADVDVLEEAAEESEAVDETETAAPDSEADDEALLGQIINEAFEEITAEITAEEEDVTPATESDQPRDLAQILEEEEEAIRALEEMAPKATDEKSVVLDDWDEFESDDEDAADQQEDLDDLDRLIHELESARIIPQPDLADMPPLDLEDDIEDMVSETLARIYASQNKYEEAAHIYEQLALQEPDLADRYTRLAAEMRTLAGDDGA